MKFGALMSSKTFTSATETSRCQTSRDARLELQNSSSPSFYGNEGSKVRRQEKYLDAEWATGESVALRAGRASSKRAGQDERRRVRDGVGIEQPSPTSRESTPSEATG